MVCSKFAPLSPVYNFIVYRYLIRPVEHPANEIHHLSSLAWAEMYLLIAGLVDRFDFRYLNARAGDFECDSDQFAIGTRGKGVLNAIVSQRLD